MLNQELTKWKLAQRLSGQEEIPNKNELDQLQQWCEQLAELLWRNRIQIVQVNILLNYRTPWAPSDLSNKAYYKGLNTIQSKHYYSFSLAGKN